MELQFWLDFNRFPPSFKWNYVPQHDAGAGVKKIAGKREKIRQWKIATFSQAPSPQPWSYSG